MKFRILHQDEHLIAIDKPAGFHVHPPEDESHRIPKSQNCLYLLRRQIDRYLYPVHRLDRATSGVLVFALDPDTARAMGSVFTEKKAVKRYFAVTRGWVADQGVIDHPLKSEHDPEDLKESVTSFWKVAQIELPRAVGKYPTARYSLVKVEPHTGRMHQIRRHFAHLSHPLVGDTIYGDGAHNRFFREMFGRKDLLLKAHSLQFSHPASGEAMRIESHWKDPWHRVFDLFGVCAYRG